MGTPQSNPQGYAASCVMHHVDALRGRLLLVHGLIDENVHFRHTARLINALIQARKTYDLLLFPDERHMPRGWTTGFIWKNRLWRFSKENWAINEQPGNGHKRWHARITTDILIVGGGLGGVAAALAALKLGRQVILTEETDWIGGQLTAQAVPPDENPWIESVGGTNSYQRLREGIRAYLPPALPAAAGGARDRPPQPGQRQCIGAVPRAARGAGSAGSAAAAVPGRAAAHRPARTTARYRGRNRTATLCARSPSGTKRPASRSSSRRSYILDATELGDLLELAGVEHVIGSESQAQTGEPHALPGAPDPLDQQAITWCFAMDYTAGADFTIPRPDALRFLARR